MITAARPDPKQVFISHAGEDADVAHRLAGDLRREGYKIWIAPESIQPGKKWVAGLERGLAGSGVILLLVTLDAARSQWVRNETNVALDLEALRRSGFLGKPFLREISSGFTL